MQSVNYLMSVCSSETGVLLIYIDKQKLQFQEVMEMENQKIKKLRLRSRNSSNFSQTFAEKGF